MAIMHLYLLLLNQIPATEALDRYVAFRKSGAYVSADFNMKIGGYSLKGTTGLEKTRRLIVRYSANGLNYVLSMTPERYIELDHLAKVYDEAEGAPEVGFRKSNLFFGLKTYPSWLFESDFRKAAPNGVIFQAIGKETLDGSVCDLVRSNFDVHQAKGFIEAAIDGKGRIHRANIEITNPMGRYAYEWFVPRMSVSAAAPADAFKVEIPDGYVPYKLPWKDGPVQAGSKFPLNGWVGAHGKPSNLVGRIASGGAILVFLSEDEDMNKRISPALGELRKVATVLTVSTSAKTIADLYDPTGKLLRQVVVPGTPLFVHLDKGGVVRHLWMGYDSEKESAFLSEVRNAIGSKE